MVETQKAKVGIAEVRDLFPNGRSAYAAARDHIMNRRDFRVCEYSPAARVLGLVVADHLLMQPPLPDEVVGTIDEFMAEYTDYVEHRGFGYISEERSRLEIVANDLVSIVFEYGYGNGVQPPRRGMGTEM